MAVFAKEIPEFYRSALEGKICECEVGDALTDFRVIRAGASEAGEVTFNVSHEYRHTQTAELLGDHAKCNCFAGAGRACDEAMAIGHVRKEELLLRTFGN